MKKLYFGLFLTLICAVPALAQSGSLYRFDNFDARIGGRVETPQVTSENSRGRIAATKALTIENSKPRVARTLYTPASSMVMGTSLNGFTTGDQKVDSYIIESGIRNRVDPVLLYAQMHTESSFKRGAISPKGARGLMQLMPFTAKRFGVTNIFDPKQNI
jgi:soluble lytic murein transglycosylase-like protein